MRLADAKKLSESMLKLYSGLDAKVADQIAYSKHEVSCKKGCDSCCQIMAIMTPAEAVVIALELFKKPDWRALLPRLRESALQMSPIGLSEYDYAQKRLPCVFLKDRACSIYEFRPAACRFYFVITPPSQCDASNTQEVASVDTILPKAMVMQASMIAFGGGEDSFICAPLPLMVLVAMRNISNKPAELAEIDAALAGLPSAKAWCEAKVREAHPEAYAE